MKGFILGVAVTLAVLYPAATKNLLAKAVDVTNGVVTGVLEKDPWPIAIPDQKL
jgi:hypothetical protein